MTEAAMPTRVLITRAATLAPLLAEQTKGFRVPVVVIELLLGILFGPFVLNLAHPNGVVVAFSDMGLTFLMFMAGYELDLKRLKGRLGLTAPLCGWRCGSSTNGCVDW